MTGLFFPKSKVPAILFLTMQSAKVYLSRQHPEVRRKAKLREIVAPEGSQGHRRDKMANLGL